jgi:hypothetical protein
MQRPQTVDRAFWLIVGSALLGLLSYVMRGMHESPGMVAFVMACLIGFAFLFRAGKNWARIVYMVFFVLGLAGVLLAGGVLARLGVIYIAILALQTAFQGYALWLAFRAPGNLWFKRHRAVQS